MNEFTILVDSESGIRQKDAGDLQIEVLAGTAFAKEQMIEILKSGRHLLYITTSLINRNRYRETYLLVEQLEKEWLNRRVRLLDAKCLSISTLLLAIHGRNLRQKEYDIDEVYQRLEGWVDRIQNIIWIEDILNIDKQIYLQKDYQKILPYLLQQRPIIELNKLGQLVQTQEVRGREDGKRQLLRNVHSRIDEYEMEDLPLIVGYTGKEQQATGLVRRLERIFSKEVICYPFVPPFADRLGEFALGVFFLGKS